MITFWSKKYAITYFTFLSYPNEIIITHLLYVYNLQ